MGRSAQRRFFVKGTPEPGELESNTLLTVATGFVVPLLSYELCKLVQSRRQKVVASIAIAGIAQWKSGDLPGHR